MKNNILSSLFSIITLVIILTYSIPVQATGNDEPKKKSQVVTLTTSNYSAEIKNGLVFVDFWAAWCPPCRRIAPILEEIAIEYKDAVKIGKLNADNYKSLAIKQGVKALPTIIVYKDGKEMTRIVGLVKKEELVKVIEKYSDKN